MTSYIKVRWTHAHPNMPVWLYSELDDSRWETRKIEIFLDGRRGFATATESGGDTRLGVVPVPSLGEINSDSEFEAESISRAEFETVWLQRTSVSRNEDRPLHSSDQA